MLNRKMIKQTEAFLKRKFDAAVYLNAHPDAKAYRLEHSWRVANIARQIAQKEGFDETELVIAGLLHDVSYCEEFGRTVGSSTADVPPGSRDRSSWSWGSRRIAWTISATGSPSTSTTRRISPGSGRRSRSRSETRTTSPL